MTEKQNMKEEKSYVIKIPVYTSERRVDTKGVFEQTYDGMTSYVIEKVKQFNNITGELTRNHRNKVKTTKIDSVEFKRIKIGEVESTLLKFSAYTTNHNDGFVVTSKKVKLKQKDKVGSDTNYVLLYPIIQGISSDRFRYHWLILIYEDPSKQNNELVSNVKSLLRHALNIKVKNIKLPVLLDKLKKIKRLPELDLKFTSYENGENDVDSSLRPFLVKSRLLRQRKESFKDIPFEKTESIIADDTFEDGYNKREIKVTIGNQEYKISKELIEAKEKVNSLVEEIFNSKFGVKESEIGNIYKNDFIIDIMTQVITNYLSGLK